MMSRNVRLLIVLAFALSTSAAFATNAGARYVYWTGYDSGELLRTDVDGGAAEVVVASAGTNPNGVAVDRATGRIFWAVRGNNEIRSVLPDGSDGQTLNVTGATIEQPVGVAIDARTQRIYWANAVSAGTIGWAALDGSGGGNLNTGSAVIESPQGVALDTIVGRLYWANTTAGTEMTGWTSLDGSGVSGNLGGPAIATPVGLAFSWELNRIFWADYGGGDTTAVDVTTGSSAAVSSFPVSTGGAGGVTLDAATGRLYISGYNNSTIFAINADGSGGGQVITATSSPWGNPAVDGAGALAPASATVSAAAGGTATGTLHLTNSGDYPIELYDRTFASPQFAAGSGCPDRLIVGGVCDLTLSFTNAGSDVATTLTIATDAGSFDFAVTGTNSSPAAPEPQLSRVKAATRCSKSNRAGSLSVSFLSATAVRVTAKLRRSSRQVRWVPTRCPRLFGGAGNGTKLTGKTRSKSFDATSGSQAFTLKQLFKVNELTPGRYRLALSYKNASGQTVTKSTWFWVLR